MKFFEDQKILITGGGGYLGSKIAERFAASNAIIYLCDIKFNKLSQKLNINYRNVHTIRFDITKKKNVNEVCKKIKPDYVYHFAALLNRERDFSNYPILYKINVQGTINLLEALKAVDYKGFFFSSTSEIYGINNKPPFKESQIPDPVSPYSLTKVMAEYLIKTYSQIYSKPFTILRIFNFFGIDMPKSFFINQLSETLKKGEVFEMTGGGQKRDFIQINDLLSVIISITKLKDCNAETLNICSGRGIKIKDIAIKISKKLKKEHLLKIGALPYRNNEIWNMIGSNNKIKSRLPQIIREQKSKYYFIENEF